MRTYPQLQDQAQQYDVSSDIYSQVYGGRSAERFRTNLAAGSTKGEILTFQNNVLPAYFHSNSGGYTEDVSELWKQNLSPLKGVPDEYSEGAPHYTWKKNFQSSAVQKKLNDGGFKIGAIEEIKVLTRNRSGRIRQLEIKDREGKTVQIDGKSFRNILGPNDVKSNNYEVVMRGYFFDLQGKGWGHGVGMSQWGAFNMAEKRFSYKEILNYYYPGAEVEKLR
jgi:stage II sporulation protein D